MALSVFNIINIIKQCSSHSLCLYAAQLNHCLENQKGYLFAK